MHAGNAVEGAAAARRVGKPGIARSDDVVHGGAHRIARIAVGRYVVNPRAQFEFRMIGAHPRVIRAGLPENSRGELIPWKGLHFVGLSDGVLAVEVLLELFAVDAAINTKDAYIDRKIVAIPISST